MTQGLYYEFLLSTLDLIAAINTNYASLSMKLWRTGLEASAQYKAEGQTEQLFLILAMSVGRKQPSTAMCLSLLLQSEFFTFTDKHLSLSAPGA